MHIFIAVYSTELVFKLVRGRVHVAGHPESGRVVPLLCVKFSHTLSSSAVLDFLVSGK